MAGLLTPLPLQFIRQYAGAVDQDDVFINTSDRVAYLTNPRRYAGMIVTDLQEEKVYYLNHTKDAWLEVGSADFTIETNKTDITTLITNNQLLPGALYKIDGVDVPLYGGTTVFVKAVSTNQLSRDGNGIFYNPKYDQTKEDYGIWNNVNTWVTSSVVGTFKGNEAFTANNGAKGTLFTTIEGNKFIITSGSFASGVTSITGDVSAATANVASIVLKSYTSGSKVIWGGKHWTNVNGNIGASTNDLTLNAEWTAIPYDATNYNVVVDDIEYDYENDLIVKREDKHGNVVISTNADVVRWGRRVISYFQWGNPYVISTIKGTGNNSIINSFANCVNNIGCFAYNKAYDASYFDTNKTYIGYFIGNVLYQGSSINSNTLLNSRILSNILNAGSNNDAFKPSSITSNILNVAYITANNLSQSSNINSNTAYLTYVYENNLSQRSTINSNIFLNTIQVMFNNLTQAGIINTNTCVNNINIWHNTIYYAAGIEQNTLTKFSQIYNNTLQNGSKIQINTLQNGVSTFYPTTIYGCRLDNGFIRENTIQNVGAIYNVTTLRYAVADNLYGSIKGSNYIRYCTITGNNSNSSFSATIESCTLKASNIHNLTVDSGNRVRGLEYTLVGTVDFNNIPLIGNYVSQKIDENSGMYNQKITFNGAAGKGAIGAVSMPYFYIPAGYFIEEVIAEAASLVGTGAIINLGIEGDNTKSALNDITGDISALNAAGLTKISLATFTKATTARKLVMEVKTANITSGSINLIIKLSKLI